MGVLQVLTLLVASLGVGSFVSYRSTESVQAAPRVDSIASPRLTELWRQHERGDRTAIARFWTDIEREGTPLVEPIAGRPDSMLVTFVWRGDASTRTVIIMGSLGGFEPDSSIFSLLSGTNVWHRSFRVRSDLLTTYWLSPNDPLTRLAEVEDFAQRMATVVPDPHNPHQFSTSFGPPQSVVALPQAPAQPWVAARPDTPAGEVTLHDLRSEILGNERTVTTYTPPGYDPQRSDPYWLLTVFDGNAYTTSVPTPTILDNMINDGRIPPMVAVLIGNAPDARSTELPNHQPFADFLATELIPWVRARYHVTTNPRQTIVAGSSYGGLASAFAGLRYPSIFGNILSQSGSYWWRPPGNANAEHEWLTAQYVASPTLPLQFYLDVGLLESGPTPGQGPSQLHANRHMRNVLAAKGYPLTYREYYGGHEYIHWRGTLSDGLLWFAGNNR